MNLIRMAAAALLVAVPAFAQDSVNLSGSIITLRPSQAPGAVGEVVLDNRLLNSVHDEVRTDLSMPGLSVGIAFDWNMNSAGADAIRVMPPEGIICVPHDCVLVVAETQVGTLVLFDLQGVGM